MLALVAKQHRKASKGYLLIKQEFYPDLQQYTKQCLLYLHRSIIKVFEMGISDRRERDREEMRELILDQARRLFLKKGFEKTSIRNIADAIEYSPATIYLYYRDKNELFLSLHREAFLKMMADFSETFSISDPLERLIVLGHKYIAWAIENPELYDLCFLMDAPMEALACKMEEWDEGEKIFQFLKSIISECMDKGYLDSTTDLDNLALTIWSFVHGLVTIYLKNRMLVFPDDNHLERINKSYELFVEMLRKVK